MADQQPIRVVRTTITRAELGAIAAQQFGDMLKAVVDTERSIMAIGGDLHSDEEAALLADGSLQSALWGINLYPAEPGPDWIEYDSMINVRPAAGNRSRGVDDEGLRQTIRAVVASLVADA